MRLKAWITAARPFAIPFWFSNTLLGIALAHGNIRDFWIAFSVCTLLGLATHFMNNWRDYVRGVDSIAEGSVEKAYTSASKLLPSGILTVRDMKIAFSVCIIISFIIMVLTQRRLDTWLLYFLGVFVAVTYTDVFKPRGLGEISLFLGWGFVVAFSYSVVRPITMTGIVASCLVGLFTAVIYTLDQLPDVETDLAKKIKNIAYYVAKAKVPLSAYIWFAGSAVTTLTIVFVLVHILPMKFLYSILILPILHVTGVVLDNDFGKGVMLGLICLELYSLIPAIALLL